MPSTAGRMSCAPSTSTASARAALTLEPCALTDDGQRCALEYNCVRWGSHDLPPQAGLAVFERGARWTPGGGPGL